MGAVNGEHTMPFSEVVCDSEVDGAFREVFDGADISRNISVEKAVVEAGEESWGEAV